MFPVPRVGGRRKVTASAGAGMSVRSNRSVI